MRSVAGIVALLLSVPVAVPAVQMRDIEGVVYEVRPGGDVALVPRGEEPMVELPPFVAPCFERLSDGCVRVAIQTASGVELFRLDPATSQLERLALLRGASQPKLAAGGLFFVVDDGRTQELRYSRCVGGCLTRSSRVARADLFNGYSVAEGDGRTVVAYACGDVSRIYAVAFERGAWRKPVPVSAAGRVRFNPDATLRGGRLVIACLGLQGNATRVYLLCEGCDGRFSENALSPADEDASSPVLLEDGLLWISRDGCSSRILASTLDGRSPRLAGTCRNDAFLTRLGESIFCTPSRGLDRLKFADLPRYESQPCNRAAPFAAEPNPDHYVGFGDSIMEGCSAHNDGSELNAFYPYWKEQLTLTYGAAEVYNEGTGGDKTKEGMDRIGAVLTADTPGYICIMEGTNDITRRYRDNYSPYTTARDLLSMAQDCKAAGAVPIMTTIIPRTKEDPYDPTNSLTERWNRAIQRMIKQNDLAHVDLFRVYYNYPSWQNALMKDRLHPNPTGYQVMGEVWLQAILAIKGPPPPPPGRPAIR